MKKFNWLLLLVTSVGITTVANFPVTAQEDAAQTKKAKQAERRKLRRETQALERTRKQVRMLDDIYKGGVVLITTHYVTEDTDLPAGAAFKKLFQTAKDKGWHEVRLLDATGIPTNDENSPNNDFEKKAIKELKSGKAWYEEVEVANGKRFLRAATPIPVVMEKCVMCHDHYADAKKGEAIGALGYRIPIE